MDENNLNENNQIENSQDQKKNNKKNKASYTLWIVAGAYLLYMVYRLFSGYIQGDDGVKPWMLVVCVVFAVAAIGMIVMAFKGISSLAKEDAAAMQEEAPEESGEPVQQPARKLSISEKAHLADNVQVPEGVVSEIGEETEEE